MTLRKGHKKAKVVPLWKATGVNLFRVCDHQDNIKECLEGFKISGTKKRQTKSLTD